MRRPRRQLVGDAARRAGSGLDEPIGGILITLSTQYHIIRPLAETPEVFLYLVLESGKANLALARVKVKQADAQLEL